MVLFDRYDFLMYLIFGLTTSMKENHYKKDKNVLVIPFLRIEQIRVQTAQVTGSMEMQPFMFK